jgi:hypothetical protein
MTGQVLLDLALGLDDETEAPAISSTAGRQPERKGACVPERIEQARAIV